MNTNSLDYIDDLYVQFVNDPTSVSESWRRYFQEFSLSAQSEGVLSEPVANTSGAHSPGGSATGSSALIGNPSAANAAASSGYEDRGASAGVPDALWLARMQERVDQLVREYRVRGHLAAKIDPLGFARKTLPELDPGAYGLTEEDLQRPFTGPNIHYTGGRTLNDI
ncbi:MAG: 2-oxoglutarate dehydrogenase component, partial [Planctomycetota bacterium]